MKPTTFFLGLVATTSANIIFTHVPLKCNLTNPLMYRGCLRGQTCSEVGECVPMEKMHYPLSFRPESNTVEERQSPAYSTDGTCGPNHGNTICDPNSTVYSGTCCSQYGWCGNTTDHCGTGCLSGCTGSPATLPATGPAPRPDGMCGAAYGGATCDPNGPYGGCCSQYGYCGSSPAHCGAGCQNGCSGSHTTIPTSTQWVTATIDGQVVSWINNWSGTPAAPTDSNTPPGTTVAVRADGRCGSDFGDAGCDPSGPYGGCCSQYGYCGSTQAHCGQGCQNGCNGSPTQGQPPATTSAEPVIAPQTGTTPPNPDATTTDGTCGSSNGNTVCGNWPNGNCCSMYGFCGSTSAHCGAGCQSGNCLSAPIVPAPGPSPAPAAPNGGSFIVVGQSGVPAMHAGLLPNGQVFFLDKLENYTQLKTADGYYAMSSEYNPVTNQPVALSYLTNAFCSGGSYLADGRVINVGGNAPLTWLNPNIGDGFTAIRYLQRSPTDASLNGQGWSEPGNKLSSARWYATAQTMPDGTVFVASGSLNGLDPTVLSNNNPTYEILSPQGITQGNSIPMDILVKNQPYYMYPFVHLMSDGNLFVFVSKACQIFSVGSNTIVKELPDLPGDYRTYPNTGGSVMLPLSSSNNWQPDIIICGGGAYQDITSPTDPSCGRMQPLSANPTWEMDSMPEGRGMVEGTLLPDGTVLWLNGGSRGAQGFGLCADPTLEALLYNPTLPLGQRWESGASSTIPRLYHSVALLMPDATVLIAGSNPVQMPMLEPDANNPYVTEFRVEKYVPPYLQGDNANRRPSNVQLSSTAINADGTVFLCSFTAPANAQKVEVVLYHGGFVTHSVHMGARMMQLDVGRFVPGSMTQNVVITGPPNNDVAPPGPYWVYVVVDGVPSIGQFVSVNEM